MSHNQFAPLWNINRASVFVEAVDLAVKAGQQAEYRRRDGSSQRPSPSRTGQPLSVFNFSPRFAVAALAMMLLSGLAVASWIA